MKRKKASKKASMDVKTYCESMRAELVAWKAKVDDIVLKFDKLPTADKEKVTPKIRDLHILIEELDDRISRLQRECPTDWTAFRGEIEDKVTHLQSRIQTVGETGQWG